jgi:DNA polymerase-3 subunit delta
MPAPIKSDELFQAWSRGQWKSVYLFAGQEDFLIDQALEEADRHWLGEDASGLNKDRFDAEKCSVSEILEACRTVPFMGKHKVIRVDNTAKWTPQDQEFLTEALLTLPAENALLLIWGKEWRRDDARRPLIEKILETGQVVIFWPPFPEQAQRWVLSRAKHYKKSISPESAAWLVQQAGEGLRLLDQELAKCSVYVGNRPALELEDVQASFGYHKASSPFEWLACVRRKDSRAAMQVLHHLLEEDEEPLRLLAMGSRALRDWLSAKESGESSAILAMRFHIKRGEENRFGQELARWSEEELIEGLRICLEAEQSIKTGKETPEMALTLLTLGLSRRETAHALG